VGQLGANANGEVLESGRVPDCYLGLLLDQPGDGTEADVLVVAPAALLYPHVPQPDGTLLYELLTGHPDRASHELVFVADLTCELRTWPRGTWAIPGADPHAAASAVVDGWQRGYFKGLQFDGLTAEEALALARPAMTYVRGQLRDRLGRQVWAGPPPLAAPDQRPSTRRPLPVTHHPRRSPRSRRGRFTVTTALPDDILQDDTS